MSFLSLSLWCVRSLSPCDVLSVWWALTHSPCDVLLGDWSLLYVLCHAYLLEKSITQDELLILCIDVTHVLSQDCHFIHLCDTHTLLAIISQSFHIFYIWHTHTFPLPIMRWNHWNWCTVWDVIHLHWHSSPYWLDKLWVWNQQVHTEYPDSRSIGISPGCTQRLWVWEEMRDGGRDWSETKMGRAREEIGTAGSRYVCGHPFKLADSGSSATPVADGCIKSSTQACNHQGQTLAVERPYWRAQWLSTWHRHRMPPFQQVSLSNFWPVRASLINCAVILNRKCLSNNKNCSSGASGNGFPWPSSCTQA